jgi:nucleoid-associated protein YgaU
MDPIFTEIINADTSAESIFRDRLQALDQWMKDPILDPLSEVYEFLQGRVGTSGASGMSGDAVDVTDEDWTETAVFVERMLGFLYPARRPSRDVSRDRLTDVSDKIADFMGMTDSAQRAKLEERIERQVTQLQTLTAQLKSKQIKIPNWLNINKLEQNLKKEANSKAKELAKRWASKKQKGADEHEQAVIAEEESSGHVAVEEPDCLPGDAKVEAEEARDRRENIREDAQARGENADQALKEDDARTQNETTKSEEAGGGTCGGGGAGGCAGQTNSCECAPEPTEAEKDLPVEPQLETYVVLKGDWLSKIAKEKLGDAGRWRDLYELNKAVIDKDNLKRRGNTDKSFNWIYPGQILTLPPSDVQPETDDNLELVEV